MKKMKNTCIVKASVLFLATLMVLSSIVVIADTSEAPMFSTVVSADTSEAVTSPTSLEEVYLGYDMDTNTNSIGLSSGGTFEAAIRLTIDELAMYEGYEITAIRIHHGYAADPNDEVHEFILKVYQTTNPVNPGCGAKSL